MKKIVVENLDFKYYNSDFSLKNINLEVDSGEFILITGPSGCGKSTLAYCLSGIIPHCIKYGKMKGKVLVNGKDTQKVSMSDLIKEVGIVLQNPDSQIFGMSVEEDIAFGLENLCCPRDEIKRKVEEILDFLNLKKLKEDSPDCLSGGQKQRLVIGSVLVIEPEIIILDEPVSNLDPLGTKMVLLTLISLKKLGKTIILVERKIDEIIHFVDQMIALDNGKIVAKGNPRKLFEDRKLIEKLGIQPPQVVRLFYRLKDDGIKFDRLPLTIEEFVDGFHGADH